MRVGTVFQAGWYWWLVICHATESAGLVIAPDPAEWAFLDHIGVVEVSSRKVESQRLGRREEGQEGPPRPYQVPSRYRLLDEILEVSDDLT